MNDPVLKDIIGYAVKKLKENNRYCGLAEAPDEAYLNSDDGKGRDIKIVITIEDEK